MLVNSDDSKTFFSEYGVYSSGHQGWPFLQNVLHGRPRISETIGIIESIVYISRILFSQRCLYRGSLVELLLHKYDTDEDEAATSEEWSGPSWQYCYGQSRPRQRRNRSCVKCDVGGMGRVENKICVEYSGGGTGFDQRAFPDALDGNEEEGHCLHFRMAYEIHRPILRPNDPLSCCEEVKMSIPDPLRAVFWD